MGIVNLTTDSFSGDGVGRDVDAAVERARRIIEDGADIVDIGAESARADVPVADPRDEIAVVVPVIERLARETDALISIDTYKPDVAEAALRAGAHIVNDIGGFKQGTGTAEVAGRYGAALVLNYTYERPKVRPARPPVYADLIGEHLAFLRERVQMAVAAGVPEEALIVDPGVAFGKSHDEDLEVLRRLGRFRELGRPVLVAASRKHVIGAVLGLPPAERVEGTAAVVALAIAQGADIVRVHDVRAMTRVARMADAIVRGRLGDYAPGEGSWPWPAGVAPLV
ncbi:MAG TPA: dihydropteroate synthase [Dehalococcoidia bacterium]|nr:dihydropteroate synthase [Dehalococcoidia bacterium]